jgi:predicted ATP-dependent serine protease
MSKHSKHTWIVDVIEDGSASIEVDGRTVTPIPQRMLPEGVMEGDVHSVTHDKGEGKSALLIQTDPEAKGSRWTGVTQRSDGAPRGQAPHPGP